MQRNYFWAIFFVRNYTCTGCSWNFYLLFSIFKQFIDFFCRKDGKDHHIATVLRDFHRCWRTNKHQAVQRWVTSTHYGEKKDYLNLLDELQSFISQQFYRFSGLRKKKQISLRKSPRVSQLSKCQSRRLRCTWYQLNMKKPSSQ